MADSPCGSPLEGRHLVRPLSFGPLTLVPADVELDLKKQLANVERLVELIAEQRQPVPPRRQAEHADRAQRRDC